MLNHIDPQAAVTLAKQTAAKYQMSSETAPDALVAAFMEEIEPIVTHEAVKPDEYVSAIRVPITLENHALGDDDLSKRRRAFFEALLLALNERSDQA